MAYKSHNPNKEEPVQFQWQILDWHIKNELFENIGLKLEDSEISEDPYTPKKIFSLKNQLLKSDQLPTPSKQNRQSKPGSNIVIVDFIKKAVSSKNNGSKGELLVVAFEENKLLKFGLDKKVNHVSLEGDGHGYDIESYNEIGEKIFIEVKTTEGGINTSFDISSNEVSKSTEKDNYYYIYRLFNYDKEKNSAEFYILNGPISRHFDLLATQYKAIFKQ